MELTGEDEQVAKLASALLVDQGRSDLAVSARQLVRWRQQFHAIPVEGERRGGRHQSTQYRPEAAQVAAALALALDDTPRPSTHEAVLRIYGEAIGYEMGPPPTFDGVQSALIGYLADAQRKIAQAWQYRGKPRSEIPRSLRLRFDSSRQAASYLVSDGLLALLLGLDPDDGHPAIEDVSGGEVAVDVAVNELFPELAVAMPGKELRQRLSRVIEDITLASLGQAARTAEPVEFGRRCRQIAVLHDYCEALSDATRLTIGTQASVPSPLGELATIFGATAKMKAHRGLRVVVLGLAAFTRITDQATQRSLREYVIAAEPHIDAMRASAEVARTLPAHLRPALAPGSGPLFFSQLPHKEREAVTTTVRSWLDSHPGAREAVLRSQAAAQLAVGADP